MSEPDLLERNLERFGLVAFRTGQRRVLDAVMAGRDCLCIMPTGGGKSLCFQLPAIVRPGTVLVVSPLIALMKDQVDGLVARGFSATFINSSLAWADQRERMTRMAEGRYDLVYIAPERMRSRAFVESLSATTVQLLAIDEAHCISQWGHDFRPDYARIGRMRRMIGSPQTIALTATATTSVRSDVCDVLELKDPAIFVSGFARENLALAIATPSSNSVKDEMLAEFLEDNRESGIFYCSTRKACEHLTEYLHGKFGRGRSVATYHAGMDAASRRRIQEEFSGGKIDWIVATNAFGMGIDKSDLRFVVHYNLPGSIEAYYQEAGRAGRDGQPARCLLLYSWQDKFIQEFFIENSYPSPEIVRRVYEFLCEVPADPVEITLEELREQLGLSIGTEGIRVSENLLEQSGAIERMDTRQNLASVRITGNVSTIVELLPREAKARRRVAREIESRLGPMRDERLWFAPREICQALEMTWEVVQRHLRELSSLDCFDYVPAFRGRAVHVLRRVPFEQLDIDFTELKRRKDDEYRRLSSVIAFATSTRCRQLEILEYFGDEQACRCGGCDNCGGTVGDDESRTVGLHSGAAWAVQVALSGVARARGRVGQNLIAQMLAGSQSKKLNQFGLRNLSTHGLLQRLSQAECNELLTCLMNAGLATRSEIQKFRPVLSITPRGKLVLTGRELDSALRAIPEPMLKRLDQVFRNEKPRLPGSMSRDADPSDARQPPRDEAMPGFAKGASANAETTPDVAAEPVVVAQPVAQAKPEEPATRIDRPHRADYNRQSGASGESGLNPAKTRTRAGAVSSAVRPSWYWTWKLFSLGFQADEVTRIRHVTMLELRSHLEIARENSLEVAGEWMSATEPADSR